MSRPGQCYWDAFTLIMDLDLDQDALALRDWELLHDLDDFRQRPFALVCDSFLDDVADQLGHLVLFAAPRSAVQQVTGCPIGSDSSAGPVQ